MSDWREVGKALVIRWVAQHSTDRVYHPFWILDDLGQLGADGMACEPWVLFESIMKNEGGFMQYQAHRRISTAFDALCDPQLRDSAGERRMYSALQIAWRRTSDLIVLGSLHRLRARNFPIIEHGRWNHASFARMLESMLKEKK